MEKKKNLESKFKTIYLTLKKDSRAYQLGFDQSWEKACNTELYKKAAKTSGKF